MKRAFYIVFLLGVLLSMQSCDRIGNLIGESDTPKEQPAEVQAQESVDNASTDTLGTTKIQTLPRKLTIQRRISRRQVTIHTLCSICS